MYLTATFVLGLVILLAIAVSIYTTKHIEEISTCPHGYIDWDECPDCRH
jgi:hypothetical protein